MSGNYNSNKDAETCYQDRVEYDVKRFLSYIEGYKLLGCNLFELKEDTILLDVVNKLEELGYKIKSSKESDNLNNNIKIINHHFYGPREYYCGLFTIYWDDENKEDKHECSE